MAQDRGGAGVGLEDGRENPHRGGLAGAVGPEQAEVGAGLDLERDAVEGTHVAAGKHLDEVLRLHGDRRVVRIGHRQRNLVVKLFTCQDNGQNSSSGSSSATRSWGTSARPATSMRALPRS